MPKISFWEEEKKCTLRPPLEKNKSIILHRNLGKIEGVEKEERREGRRRISKAGYPRSLARSSLPPSAIALAGKFPLR